MVFLHERDDFKDLINITAREQNIKDPGLVEKDYRLMHVLWSMQQIKLTFHLKGDTSLSKGYGCIHRFSEDIDIMIDPEKSPCGFKVYTGKNHVSLKHRESRQKYFDWIASHLMGKIHGVFDVVRDKNFDDEKYRSGGIRLHYNSQFASSPGLKDGILLEVGFDRTAPNQPCPISSWAYDRAAGTANVVVCDNRALGVPCYEPKYTFVEKLQAVVRKFRHYKEGKDGANLPANFIRHYYDLYQLIDRSDVQAFIGTTDYVQFKEERFGGDDIKISNSDALKLTHPDDRVIFEKEYDRSASLYFKGRPSLEQILIRLGEDLDRL